MIRRENYWNKANVIRSQNEILNTIFQEGREINREVEIKKSHSKKDEMRHQFMTFIRICIYLKNINDDMIDNNYYLENFNPNTLDEEKEMQEILEAITKQKDNKTHINEKRPTSSSY